MFYWIFLDPWIFFDANAFKVVCLRKATHRKDLLNEPPVKGFQRSLVGLPAEGRQVVLSVVLGQTLEDQQRELEGPLQPQQRVDSYRADVGRLGLDDVVDAAALVWVCFTIMTKFLGVEVHQKINGYGHWTLLRVKHPTPVGADSL